MAGPVGLAAREAFQAEDLAREVVRAVALRGSVVEVLEGADLAAASVAQEEEVDPVVEDDPDKIRREVSSGRVWDASSETGARQAAYADSSPLH